jgi:cation/acetate symporter
MDYSASTTTLAVFLIFVGAVLGVSFYMGAQAKSARGFFAAGGQIPWFVNGIAFAGDYLSAASFLGICGLVAFYGYDGFLYSIGYLAGWVVALFVIAEPLKRLGRFTFADALDNRFQSRGIKLTAAISTLVVSIFYLIPQMVGAGSLIKPLLGWEHWQGVTAVGAVVVTIVVTAGMVSTTWVQFIKGGLLVLLCTLLTGMILMRGLSTHPGAADAHVFLAGIPAAQARGAGTELPADGPWAGKPYVRFQDDGVIRVWRKVGPVGHEADLLSETQTTQTVTKTVGVDGRPVEPSATGAALAEAKTVKVVLKNGKPDSPDNDLYPIGTISSLPGGVDHTGPVGPIEFLRDFSGSTVILWKKDVIGSATAGTTVYYQAPTAGADILRPGGSPTFAGLRKSFNAAAYQQDADDLAKLDPTSPEADSKRKDMATLTKAGHDAAMAKLDFLSLMLALFCGTASLPHILIRYYTVKDQVSARKSTIVGIAAIGFFYVLTLFLGLGAMASGALDPTSTNMAAPLLARSFNPLLFAVISAVAFTTVLGTVSGLIMAASGAVAHDICTNVMGMTLTEHGQVRVAKITAVVVGIIAILLGIAFENMNVSFLVGWAFNIAASANLPALVMLLFWKGTTKQGITAAITIGMLASLAWVLDSKDALVNVYGYTGKEAESATLVPISQPAIVTVPLGFAVLIVVSLFTRRTGTAEAVAMRVLQRKDTEPA